MIDVMRITVNKIIAKILGVDQPTLVNSIVAREASIERKALLVRTRVDRYAYVGPECRLFDCEIDPYVSLGPRVTVGENEHDVNAFSTSDVLFEGMPRERYLLANGLKTRICADAWVGANAFIRKGVTIGTGAVIGAHSVVLTDVAPFSVVVGVPARKLRSRFSEEVCIALLDSNWWERDRREIQGAILRAMKGADLKEVTNEVNILEILARLADRPGN